MKLDPWIEEKVLKIPNNKSKMENKIKNECTNRRDKN